MILDQQVLPITLGAWVALALSVASFIGIFIGWGKNKQIFDDYGKRLERFERFETESTADRQLIRDDVRKITFTLWGPTGTNGMSSQVKEILDKVGRIERMSDAEEARRQGALEVGHEARLKGRRKEDRILRNDTGDSDGTGK